MSKLSKNFIITQRYVDEFDTNGDDLNINILYGGKTIKEISKEILKSYQPEIDEIKKQMNELLKEINGDLDAHVKISDYLYYSYKVLESDLKMIYREAAEKISVIIDNI